jgi:hypothetical protein
LMLYTKKYLINYDEIICSMNPMNQWLLSIKIINFEHHKK